MTANPKKKAEPSQASAVPPQPAPAPEKPAFQTLSDREFLYVLGEVTWLMGRSPKHKHLFLADYDWLVAPPLLLKQARIFRNKPATPDASTPPSSAPLEGTPLAFVSWAVVSDEVDARLKSGIIRLQPGDWRSGPHPWIIDVVAPFGGADKAIAEVVQSVFQGRPVSVAGTSGIAAPDAAPKNGEADRK